MSGMYEGAIQDLIDALGRLPGIGPKSAQRIAFLPQAQVVSNSHFELLYGTPHGASFEHLAATHGIAFERVTTVAELASALQHSGTRLIEVPCDRSANVSQHEALQSAVIAAVEATT